MLAQLYIKNYALIDELDVSFDEGLTIITGETGAGKSILLGGLSLVLGKRVDFSNITTNENKSSIECSFNIEASNTESRFATYNLEYEQKTNIRRERVRYGKSRT